jgi:hypothetical protein
MTHLATLQTSLGPIELHYDGKFTTRRTHTSCTDGVVRDHVILIGERSARTLYQRATTHGGVKDAWPEDSVANSV